MQLNIAIYQKIDNIMFMENTNIKWEKPVIDELGSAKDLIKGNFNQLDSKNSLAPVDAFNANIS